MSCRWIILWAMLAPFLAQAEGKPPAADIEARFAAMQAQLNALNKRLERLEHPLQSHLRSPDAAANATTVDDGVAAATSAPPAASPPVQPALTALSELETLRTNWKQLKRGLTRTELRQLLGKPGSELALGRQTMWYYRYPGIGGGSVILDSTGKVTGWQEPPFRGW